MRSNSFDGLTSNGADNGLKKKIKRIVKASAIVVGISFFSS